MTPALARSVAVNDTLVVAVANYAVLPLVRNLARHLDAQGERVPSTHAPPQACVGALLGFQEVGDEAHFAAPTLEGPN